ncbi:MAG: protein kinase [Spartobacteria bacterium]
MPEEVVLAAGIQAAQGLRAAYAKGLIHRDVKPANILFADEHTAKIGDFGLAGVAAEKAENEIWGTPYYVAPERLNNEPEDFRSDIFASETGQGEAAQRLAEAAAKAKPEYQSEMSILKAGRGGN